MKCNKCNAEISKDDAFCPECGKKIEIKKEETTTTKSNKTLWIIIASVITILLIALIALLFLKSDKPLCNSPYIQVGNECCLDQNNNKICDKDETTAPTQTQQPTTNTVKNEPVIDNTFIGGSKGIVARFEPMGVTTDGTSQAIFNDESFPIIITLNNKGEYDIPSNTLSTTIKGISSSDFKGITFQLTNSETVNKITSTNINGGEIKINHGLGKLEENRIKDRNVITAGIYADIIYPYNTIIKIKDECLKNNCNSSNSKNFIQSGAPIQIESLSINNNVLTLSVINSGNGETTTSSQDFDYRYNKFEIKTENNLICNKETNSIATFGSDNKITITCTPKTGSLTSNDDTITLTYKYKQTISTDLVIKNKNV